MLTSFKIAQPCFWSVAVELAPFEATLHPGRRSGKAQTAFASAKDRVDDTSIRDYSLFSPVPSGVFIGGDMGVSWQALAGCNRTTWLDYCQ
jgi:hypothetical protein